MRTGEKPHSKPQNTQNTKTHLLDALVVNQHLVDAGGQVVVLDADKLLEQIIDLVDERLNVRCVRVLDDRRAVALHAQRLARVSGLQVLLGGSDRAAGGNSIWLVVGGGGGGGEERRRGDANTARNKDTQQCIKIIFTFPLF